MLYGTITEFVEYPCSERFNKSQSLSSTWPRSLSKSVPPFDSGVISIWILPVYFRRGKYLTLVSSYFYSFPPSLTFPTFPFPSSQCPIMCAGPRFEYHWQDTQSQLYKKPTKMSAPDYVDCLMTWVQSQLDDESVFPSKIGVPFPSNFQSTIKSILRRLFRVYAHVYNHHFAQICALSIEG